MYIIVPINHLIMLARGFCLFTAVHCINMKQTFVNFTSFTSTQPLSAQLCVGNSLTVPTAVVLCDATHNDISVEVLSEDIDPVMIWKGVAMTFCLLCIVSTLLRGSVGDRKTALLFVFSRAVDICKSLDVFAICLIFL